MSAPINISVILPVHNRREITLSCLQTLQGIRDHRYRLKVIVVDDGSTDGTGTAIRARHSDVEVLQGDGNLWWAGGVNAGLKAVGRGSDYILLLNDDTDFSKETLDLLVETVSMREKTVVSALCLDAETGRIFCTGHWKVGFLQELKPLHQGELYDEKLPDLLHCDSVSSRTVIFPCQLVLDIGLFDNRRFPHNFSDLDYFLRAKENGYDVAVATRSVVRTSINGNYHFSSFPIKRLLQSYFDVRYGNNLSLMYHSSFAHRPFLIGGIVFGRRVCRNLKIVLSRILKSLFQFK